MDKIIASFLCFIFSFQVVSAETISLPKNTAFKVSMQSTIDSYRAKDNSIIAATLTENLIINKKLIAPKGSIVYGEITRVRQNVLLCADGLVGFKFNEIVTPDNRNIKISCKDFVFATTIEENNWALLLFPEALVNMVGTGAIVQAFGLVFLPLQLLNILCFGNTQANRDILREISKIAFAGVILVPYGVIKNNGTGSPVIVQAGTPLTVVVQ